MNENLLFTKPALTFLIGNAPFSQSGYIRKYVCLLGDRVGCKRIVAFIGMLAAIIKQNTENMTEKVKFISNPLTIIAIFAALAEVNATVSIGLVDKELQQTFIWFVILFPTLLIVLFFLTLNYNTKVIYAPSDYKTDESFQKMLLGEPKPDKEINFDKDIIKKTIQELGIKGHAKGENIDVSDDIQFLFRMRYNIEKELRRIVSKFIDDERTRPIMMMLPKLVEQELISPKQHKVIRNLYSIASPAIHGDEQRLTVAEIDFARQIAPSIIDELRKIE